MSNSFIKVRHYVISVTCVTFFKKFCQKQMSNKIMSKAFVINPQTFIKK